MSTYEPLWKCHCKIPHTLRNHFYGVKKTKIETQKKEAKKALSAALLIATEVLSKKVNCFYDYHAVNIYSTNILDKIMRGERSCQVID